MKLKDHLIVKKNNQKPDKPNPISPLNEIPSNHDIILKASPFYDSDNDGFGSAHFQISTSLDFSNPIFEDWKQHENWYFNTDTQKDDDLTDIKVSNLNLEKKYYWRVRYRDKSLAWSDWSDPEYFKVIKASYIRDSIAKKSKLTVFPNPSEGVFNIQTTNLNYNVSKIEIINLVGETVFVKKTSGLIFDYKINLTSLKNGLYVISITMNDGVINKVNVVKK